MKYALTVDGAFNGRVEEFDSPPDPNPSKGFVWLPYVEQADPTFDPATHELTDFQFTVSEDSVTRARSVVALSGVEALEGAIARRRSAYHSGTLGLKGIQGDEIAGLGFWVDALVSELEARGAMQTAEMQALVAMRAAVKAAEPKP